MIDGGDWLHNLFGSAQRVLFFNILLLNLGTSEVGLRNRPVPALGLGVETSEQITSKRRSPWLCPAPSLGAGFFVFLCSKLLRRTDIVDDDGPVPPGEIALGLAAMGRMQTLEIQTCWSDQSGWRTFLQRRIASRGAVAVANHPGGSDRIHGNASAERLPFCLAARARQRHHWPEIVRGLGQASPLTARDAHRVDAKVPSHDEPARRRRNPTISRDDQVLRPSRGTGESIAVRPGRAIVASALAQDPEHAGTLRSSGSASRGSTAKMSSGCG